MLLGAIIEKASGKSYEAFVRDQRLPTPLGMTQSFYGGNEPLIMKRAQGHVPRDGQVFTAEFLSMTQPYTAGSLV